MLFRKQLCSHSQNTFLSPRIFFSSTVRLTSLVVLFVLSGCQTHHHPEKKPNILFILVDDLGIKDLGVYGSRFHQTPNIDALADDSLVFREAYAASPVCSPTRTAILSGQNPARLQITDWIKGWGDKGKPLATPPIKNALPLETVTLAELAKQQGYKTFFAGKWHLGGEGFLPEDQGFDINIGGYERGGPATGYYSPYGNPKLPDGPPGEYLPDRLTTETLDFISANKHAPFFAYLSFYTVHTPVQAATSTIDYYREAAAENGYSMKNPAIRQEGTIHMLAQQLNPAYGSMVSAMDQNIGRLITRLKNEGLLENTLIVFTSDNGGLSASHNRKRIHKLATSNEPYRAGKGFLYEGGIRIPLIIRLPQQGMPQDVDVARLNKSENRDPAFSVDMYPTLANVMGVSPTQLKVKTDGRDLLNNAPTATAQERSLFWHYPHYHIVGWTPGSAVRQGPWKLIHFYENERSELYNLDDDPAESTDVAQRYPNVVRDMKQLLEQHIADTGAQRPVRR